MKANSVRYVSMIKNAGYRVFMRNPQTDEFCFYTDGTRIGYAEWGGVRGPCVDSVHIPNMQSGSGFIVADEITPESIAAAIDCHAPDWARTRERDSVRKYPNWEAFHAENEWNADLVEV